MPHRLEITHLKSENRMLSILVALMLIQDSLDPVQLVAWVQSSVVARVAELTGHPKIVAVVFAACALSVTPFLAASLVRRWNVAWRVPTARLACLGLSVAGLQWLLLAYLSSGLGTGTVSQIFGRYAIMSIAFAGALAISINNHQVRQCKAGERCEVQA